MAKYAFKLTESDVAVIKAPAVRTDYFSDDRSGIVLRVSPLRKDETEARKVFYLMRRIEGRLERIKLGTYGQLTVQQAKNKAKILNGQIAESKNPAELKRALKGEVTLTEAFALYLEQKQNRRGQPLAQRTKTEYTLLFERYLKPLANKKLSKITAGDFRACYVKIESAAQRNKLKVLVDAIFKWSGPQNQALSEAASPAKQIKTIAIDARKRYLKPDELGRFLKAVLESDSVFRDVFLVAAGTGARRSNVLAMRWRDLDLKQGVWVIRGAEVKNGETTTLALHKKVVALLRLRRRHRLLNAEYVFPNAENDGPLSDPKAAWRKVLERAGIENLRLHDIRRSVGSYAAMNGASLRQIGRILGQKSPEASAIYAEIVQESQRELIDSSVNAMLGKALGGKK